MNTSAPWQGRRYSPRYHPDCPEMIVGHSVSRYRAKPGAGYYVHRRSLPCFQDTRRVQPLRRSADTRRAHTKLSRLAGRWLNTPGKASLVFRQLGTWGLELRIPKCLIDFSCLCGPREIRTLGLLNAIETRSQLRYGPRFLLFSL